MIQRGLGALLEMSWETLLRLLNTVINLVHLRIRDIDSLRMTLRVDHDKGITTDTADDECKPTGQSTHV